MHSPPNDDPPVDGGLLASERQAKARGDSRLPDLAIESAARGFFREADKYGFSQVDFVRFINRLLDHSMATAGSTNGGTNVVEPLPPALTALPLEDERIRIRAFDRSEDLPTFSRWMRDELGSLFLLASTLTRKLTLEAVVDDPASLVGVITLPDGTPIGATAFLNIDREQRKAELRKLIGEPSMRRRGYAKAASRLWIAFGLASIDLHKIYLNTLDTNLRNIRLNEALGFRLEGILHDDVLINGRFHDVLRMAIWRD